jgi:hypothetical protein
MATFLRFFLSSIVGAAIGALFFGLIIVALFGDEYFFRTGSLTLNEGGGWIFGPVTVPIFWVLVVDAVLGGIPGFVTGLIVGARKIKRSLTGAFITICVMEFLILAVILWLTIADLPNARSLSRMPGIVIETFSWFLFISMILVVPSAILGIIIVRTISAMSLISD